MKLEGTQQRLTIYVGESDRHGHTPLAIEIVQPQLDELITEGLVVREDIEVVKYVGRSGERA